jgi:hypothetical protein
MVKYQTAEIPSTLADIAEKLQNSPRKNLPSLAEKRERDKRRRYLRMNIV